MSNGPQVPNLVPQPSAPGKDQNVVWMACRAREGCEGKYARMTLIKTNPLVAGGGTWRRYQCETCGGVWSFTH